MATTKSKRVGWTQSFRSPFCAPFCAHSTKRRTHRGQFLWLFLSAFVVQFIRNYANAFSKCLNLHIFFSCYNHEKRHDGWSSMYYTDIQQWHDFSAFWECTFETFTHIRNRNGSHIWYYHTWIYVIFFSSRFRGNKYCFVSTMPDVNHFATHFFGAI